MQTITTSRLCKQFGKKTVLNGLELAVESGAAVGLLGQNGAGKTTLNRILTGLSFPTSGEVLVCGEKPRCGSGKINFLSENISIYPHMTAAENLEQIFLMNRLAPERKRILEILDQISIEDSKKKAGRFSLGMKRRLQVAMSILVVERDIMILDEPTNGLDINGVLWLKELLLSLRKKERTLIVTSHAISELESVLSHYAILSEGQVAEFGRVDHLGVQGILLTLKPADLSRAQDCLRQNAVDYESPAPDSILIPGAEERAMHRYLQLLLAQGVTPLQFSVKKHSLVDVFLSYAKEDSADGTNH